MKLPPKIGVQIAKMHKGELFLAEVDIDFGLSILKAVFFVRKGVREVLEMGTKKM